MLHIKDKLDELFRPFRECREALENVMNRFKKISELSSLLILSKRLDLKNDMSPNALGFNFEELINNNSNINHSVIVSEDKKQEIGFLAKHK